MIKEPNSLKNILSSNLVLMIFCMMLLVGGASGCKAKKEARARAAAEAEMISKAKSDLLVLLNNDNNMTLAEKERELNRIKALGINDAEIAELIGRVERKLNEEKAASAQPEKTTAPANEDEYTSLANYFQEIISTRSNSAADYMIDETLGMFASEDVPVLIIINESNGMVDYDEPTTIRKYLEYLKDQKRINTEVKNLVMDNNGKIKEVELVKKY